MYLEFFGLKEIPFSITPDPRFLYFSPRHQGAMEELVYGIEQRKGFIELVGEVGSGKTTLCRHVLSRLRGRVESALILNPCISETQMVQAILADLGAGPRGRDRLGLIRQLNAFLLDRAAGGVNVAVIIDEAQNLTDSGMEQVRLLSNLETDQQKLMQIVLSGQPELDRRIARPELRQLRQRIMVRCTLGPLDEQETCAYIRHRLGVAGAVDGAIFDDGAARMIHRRAKGIPRLINKICDRALLAAYAAKTQTVRETEVKRSLRELEELM